MKPTRPPPSTKTISSLGDRLLSDHRALDALFEALLRDIRRDDPATYQVTWARFEQAFLNHIDAEEVFLLPSFERVDPSEAAAIRQEHATLRHLLADMGVRLELHAVKEDNVKALIETLRYHGRREEASMYRWADELAPDLASSLGDRLSAGRTT